MAQGISVEFKYRSTQLQRTNEDARRSTLVFLRLPETPACRHCHAYPGSELHQENKLDGDSGVLCQPLSGETRSCA